MKTTKDIEMEVMGIHNLFWESYARRDIELRFSLCSEDVTFIGSGLHEKALNKTEYKKINIEGVKQFPDPFQIEFLWTKISMITEVVACVESEVVWSQLINSELSKELLRNTTLLKYDNSKWLVTHVHGSVPDYRLKDGDYMTNEQTIIRNRELERQVFERTQDLNKTLSELEQKNRELEIESALEKVRSSALAMKEPGDMVDVCRVISDQLQSLGVNNIRNVQTAIINEQKSTYLNYQYFTSYNKSGIEEAEYNKHPKAREMAETMKRSANASYSQSFDGKDLDVFREYRKHDNQFPDPILDKSTSLHFYFYSIGPGALGLSTYNFPLNENELIILKRFRNVFELAYRRFIDIELAIAQAKEAKIEAALEKVRAVAMSMNKPDDLLNVCEILFTEFHKLGFGEMRNAMINIHDDEKETFINYDYSDEIGRSINHLTYNIHPVIEKQIKQIRSTNDAFSETSFTGTDLEEWKKFRNKIGEKDDPRINNLSALYYYFYSIGKGSIGISTFNPIGKEKLELLKRFRNVFSLSYQRYSDIALAETQAREAQIELALERVRARTMAMQRSEELQETSYVLFEQLRNLGETAEQLSIGIFNENRGVIELSVTLAGSKLTKTYEVPFDEPFIMGKAYQAWKEKKRAFVYELSGKTLKDYNRYRNRVFGGKLSSKEKSYTKRIVYFAFFSKGVISFSSHEERPSETILLFERFAAVFDLTYTRFNDLKKAEAQAREAQIEAALEKVRSRSLAMHNSEELGEVVTVVVEKLRELDIPVNDGVAIVTHIDGSKDQIEWMENPGFPSAIKFYQTYFEHPILTDYWKARDGGLDFIAPRYTAEESQSFLNHIFEFGDYKNTPQEVKDYCLAAKTYSYSAAFQKNSSIFINDYSGRSLTEKEIDLVKRFSKVFEQVYVRFLDLQKAEAQAREAKIETALERVRARSMGMQKSQELKEVIRVVYEQFVHLKIHVDHAGFVVDYTPKGDWHFWIADEQEIPSKITHPYFESVWANQFDEAKEKSADFFATNLDFEEKNKFYNELLSYVPGLPEASKDFYLNCPGLSISTVLFENVSLYIENFSGIPYSDEENNTLMRFGKVFQQTYTRFLDLQKAEAQAREAKIEAALERVRSRTMAMHHSTELGDVAAELFDQMNQLVTNLWTCGFVLCEKDRDEDEWWLSMDSGFTRGFFLPNIGDYTHAALYEGWLKGDTFRSVQLEGETLQEHYEWLMGITVSRKIFEEMDAAGLERPDWQKLHAAYFSRGYLVLITREPCGEEEIFKRFAQVFDLVYTRFLDLQKAEAQAREAEIELSLERVRSKAMAMHSPNDLSETVNVFFKELKTLGIIPIRCGVGQIDEATRTTSLTTTTSSQQGDSFQVIGKVKQTGHPVLDGIFDHWKLQKEYHPVLEGEDIKAYYDVMNAQIGYLEYPEGVTQYGNNFFFNEGFVFAWTQNLLSEEELIIFRRFTSVLGLTYRRYMDLKEAEAQAREAQIEASLERVRSRTMAMQRSEELLQVITVLAKQFQLLNFNFDNVSFAIRNQAHDYNFWISATGLPRPHHIHVPYLNNPMFERVRHVQNNDLTIYTDTLSIEESRHWHQHVFENSIFKYLPEKTKQYILNSDYTRTIVFMPTIMLIIGNYTSILYTEEENNIFKRFAVVFEQSYTRFLDLQRAEAQARESQIEAALERVRSKAMAMHSSEDLAITVDTFFSELNNLNVTPHRCGMGIIDEQSKIVAIHATTVTHENEIKKMTGNLKLSGHPVLDSIFDNWKLQKEYHPVLRGNEIIEYYKVMNPQVSFPDFAGDETQYGYYFFFKEGGVFAWTDKELADGDLQIFRRYTSVLSLTYRRYKDLKEAEAQAREAKIEAAMEKVRARAMAMQKPGELVNVAQLLRMEMSLLGVEELETSSIYVHDSASGLTECWYAIQDIREQDKKLVTDHMTLSLNDTWVGREMMKFYASNQKQTSILMQGENRKEWINYCADHSKVLQGYYGDIIPERTYHLLKFSNGFMGSASPGDISEESWALLNRATTVFSLAYTRFLDLQKAEAQTKEAQVELALERVRARTMAMHKSDELTETAAIVFQQLNNLGIEPNRIYITIIKDETGFCEFWFTDEEGKKVSSGFKANLRENESFIKMYAGWKEKKKSLTIDMRGEELQEYFNHLSSLNVPFKGGLSQQRRIQHLAYFSKGFIGVASPDETKPETLQLLERFAAVFNLTYTRFNDLKQAEAQNQIIQAENERKTKELEEARQLQLSMLPKELPRLPHLDIAVYMKPATEVGGDYYDFNICNDGTLTIIVCDATGHGMMSGMMVSIMKSIFISNRNNIDLKEFFENTNNSLKEMHLGRLMMASLGVQITSDKVIATNAGMPSLLYFRNKSKKAGEFVSNNLPLGAIRGIKYSLKEIKYEKGDTLLLMSDGFAELRNENNEQYGYNRVKEEFRSVAQKSSNEIVEHLKISAAKWIKDVEPDDDVTFVVIKVR